MNAFFHAVAFLTRFPLPVRLKRHGWEKSPMWYPAVGLLLGAFLVLVDALVARWFPTLIRALIDTAVWVFMTGGLHLDGLMDTADGFGAYRDRERTLSIMKDSRVGAMGIIAGVFAILFKTGTLWYLVQVQVGAFTSAWLVACILGRFSAVLGIFLFPYIQPDGMGSGLKENLTWFRFLFAGACAVIPAVALLGWVTFLPLASVFVVTWMIGQTALKRIGGCTGDLYGAMIELAEIVTLLCLLLPEVRKLCA